MSLKCWFGFHCDHKKVVGVIAKTNDRCEGKPDRFDARRIECCHCLRRIYKRLGIPICPGDDLIIRRHVIRETLPSNVFV